MRQYTLHEGIFKSEGIDVEITEETINKIEDVEGILNRKIHDPKGIIIGPKGAGKSLLLSCRAWINKTKLGTKTIPKKKRNQIYAFELTDTLGFSDLKTYLKRDDYTVIWRFSLHYFIVKSLRDDHQIEIPDYESDNGSLPIPGEELLESVEGGVRNVTDLGLVVSIGLKNRSAIREFQNETNKLVEIIKKIDGLIEDSYTVYIDNVDQAFLEKLTFDHQQNGSSIEQFSNDSKSNKAKVDIWLNANIAFFLAIWNFNKKKYFVTVFASIRLEAWNHILASRVGNFANIDGNKIIVNYTTAQLRTLIDKYVQIQESAVRTAMSSLMEMDRTHPKANNEELNKEKFRDLVIRHTFGNPRDLVFILPEIGAEVVKNLEQNEEIDAESFGYLVDQMAHEIVFKRYFVPDCLPFFPLNDLYDFLNKVKRNFFRVEDIDDKDLTLVTTLYRFGLVGVVREKAKGEYVQYFLRGSNYAETLIVLEPSEIYLLHPCLDFQLGKVFEGFYYLHCVIGHGLPFNFKRAIEFYRPPLEFLPSQNRLKSKIIEIYSRFYESTYSVKAFSNVQAIVNSSYVNIFFECSGEARLRLLLSKIGASFFEKGKYEVLQASKKDALSTNNSKLIGNIRLRIVIVMAVLFEAITKGEEVIRVLSQGDKSFQNQTQFFYMYLFNQGVFRPTAKRIDKQKAFASLAEFEKKIIKTFLKCDNLTQFIHTRTASQQKEIRSRLQAVEELIEATEA